ncbi:helix-turn-helix transcriptional regulator [Pontimicrobium sp. SW4]|uniref:Helix-turn-helix transcriptional regulator n=1 Tax=Pontimicrobium sp. SW4 TaxID=3153519 RepID=A0AAU7BWR3_9FLAO
MINSKNFTIRLQQIIDYYSLSASSFADKIGVQRSSISHILSERNKPSLDFVMKILSSFPDVDLYWLLNGKGTFPKNIENKPENSNVIDKENLLLDSLSSNSTDIDRIVIFFKDGTYKNYKN